MGKSSTTTRSAKRAGEAAMAARENPYVQRLIEDEDLRDNLRAAFESARYAVQQIANGKGPAKAIQDKKVKRELRTAADSLREASVQLRGNPKKRHRGRLVVLVVVGAGLALVLSDGARKTVLDKLFGSEEEFEYTSTTSPEPETADTPAA